jgi:inorganic triphosphatase YgiF
VTNSYGDHLETEQKYDAGADFALPELGSLPGLSGRRPQGKRHYLSATYFDTEDFDLNQNRITLRRRVGGTDEGWHLKLPVRKDTRQELHAPLDDGPDGVVPARLAARVQDITAGRRLRPIAILDTERTVVTLTGKSGEPLVEVADDRVTATQFGRTGEEPLTWREIEVEVVAEGKEEEKQASQLLEEVGRVLREAGAARSTSGSKLGRLLQSLLIASPEVPDTLLTLAGNVRGDLRSRVGILGTESLAPDDDHERA